MGDVPPRIEEAQIAESNRQLKFPSQRLKRSSLHRDRPQSFLANRMFSRISASIAEQFLRGARFLKVMVVLLSFLLETNSNV
jgi:hypothetical protein